MKTTITGGGGYLGSVLVPKLLDAGHHVTVLDNFTYGDNSLGLLCSRPNFEVHRVDCRDVDAMRPHVKHADVVIPLAALVGAPICSLNPIDAAILNKESIIDLYESLSPNQGVINPSTESVYGRGTVLLDETSPVNPLVSYGVQKYEVELALANRPNSISFRMATLFGMSPRMRLDLLINDFTWRAIKDMSLVVFEGAAMRTCAHVIDAANAFVHCLDKFTNQHDVYNVGGVALSKLELCEAIKKQVPKFCYVENQFSADPDQRDYRVSQAKLEATGYKTEIALDDGIRELLMGFRMLNNSRHSNMP